MPVSMAATLCMLQGKLKMSARSPQWGFVFDGNGNLSGTLWQRINGTNVVETLTGEYSVSSNCIVRDSWHLSLGETTTHLSVIQNNGTEYVILNNTSGAPSTVSGEAKRQ